MDNRISALRVALDAGGDLLDPDIVARANAVLDRAAERRALAPDRVVVAVAGATGSGKSSLVNALADQQVAQVGVRRPTTSQAQAIVWPPIGTEDAGPLLDWLDVDDRVWIDNDPPGIILLDLPDIDSVVTANRAIADRLVGLTDVLLWVVDPQKYADAVVHNEYLKPLAALAPVSIVALNQIDRLAPDDLGTVLDHLREILDAEGLAAVPILPVAAIDGTGLDAVRAKLAELAAERSAAGRRLESDVRTAAAAIEADVAGGNAGRLGGTQITEATEQLAAAAGVPVVAQAVERDYRRRARLAAGWPITRWLEKLRPDPLRRLRLDRHGQDPKADFPATTSLPAPTPVQTAQASRALRQLGTTVGGELPDRWRLAVRAAAAGPPSLTDQLDAAIGRTPMPAATRRWWSAIGVIQWFALAVVLVGAGWLGVRAAMQALALPELPLPTVGTVPWPTVLLIGGLLVALLLTALVRLFAGIGARRASRAAQKQLTASIQEVLVSEVVAPVNAIVERLETVRTNAAAAAR